MLNLHYAKAKGEGKRRKREREREMGRERERERTMDSSVSRTDLGGSFPTWSLGVLGRSWVLPGGPWAVPGRSPDTSWAAFSAPRAI